MPWAGKLEWNQGPVIRFREVPKEGPAPFWAHPSRPRTRGWPLAWPKDVPLLPGACVGKVCPARGPEYRGRGRRICGSEHRGCRVSGSLPRSATASWQKWSLNCWALDGTWLTPAAVRCAPWFWGMKEQSGPGPDRPGSGSGYCGRSRRTGPVPRDVFV